MSARSKLDAEFSRGCGPVAEPGQQAVTRYAAVAEGYAAVENVLAVVSDLAAGESYVAHGRFSQILDIDAGKCSGSIPSIWEDDIFGAVHPDDLEMKMLQELLFYHYISRLPRGRRFDKCLMQRLRMRSRSGEWVDTLHRLYYIAGDDGRTVRLALCLYGAMTVDLKCRSVAVDMVSGERVELDRLTGVRILSPQELSVLRLIDEGNRSRGIADIFGISLHTVSRHRQNIIAKLKVRNSAEACKIARGLGML